MKLLCRLTTLLDHYLGDEKVADESEVPEVTLGKGKSLPDQTRHALSEGAVEALDVIGFSFGFAPGMVLLLRDDVGVGRPDVGKAGGSFWQLCKHRESSPRVA